MSDATKNPRRGLLRAFGAAAGVAAAAPAFAQRADQVPSKDARKENEATRLAARYQESAHVKEFYRNNRYEH